MALFHRATITPTKAELIVEWASNRPWGPSAAEPIEVIGSYGSTIPMVASAWRPIL